MNDRASHRRLVIGFALALGLSVIVVLTASVPAASAHATLVSSDPAPGSTLDDSPANVTLQFDEAVELSLGGVRIFDGDGDRLPVGEAQLTENSTQVTLALPVLQPGSYVVSYQAVSADSHPVTGAFTFQVGSVSTLGADVLADVVDGAATDATSEVLLGLTRALMYAGIALVGGGLTAIAAGVVAPTTTHRRVIQIGALLAGVTGLLALPLEVGFLTGRGVGAIADFDSWQTMIATRVGTAWALRAVVAYFGGLALVMMATHHRAGWWRSSLVGWLGAVGVASAYGGHGATGRWPLVGIAATTVHVIAVTIWIGGLVALLVRSGELSADGLRRFSRIALVSATVVVLTGVTQSLRQIESASVLVDTGYGRSLLAKILAVAILLGFAAVSRVAVGHGLLRARPMPATVGASGRDDRGRLSRSVRYEVLLATVALALTASLMSANPSAASSSEPFSVTLVSDGYIASIAIEPATVGPNQLHLYLSSPGGSLSRPDSVTVTIGQPDRNVAPIDVPVVPAGANHFQSLSSSIPFPGDWTLTVTAIYDTFSKVEFTAQVPVR